jgi:hypothetical protein
MPDESAVIAREAARILRRSGMPPGRVAVALRVDPRTIQRWAKADRAAAEAVRSARRTLAEAAARL